MIIGKNIFGFLLKIFLYISRNVYICYIKTNINMKNLTKQDARNLKKYQYLAEKFKNRNRDIYEGYLALIEMINNRQELENLIKN